MPFQKKEILEFLKLMKTEPQERYFRPCSNAEMLLRAINNLIRGYTDRNKPEMIQDLLELKEIIQQGKFNS